MPALVPTDHYGTIVWLGRVARPVGPDLIIHGEPIDEMRYLVAEELPNRIKLDERIFNNVVQEAGRHRFFVEAHLGQNVCDFERVHEIRLA